MLVYRSKHIFSKWCKHINKLLNDIFSDMGTPYRRACIASYCSSITFLYACAFDIILHPPNSYTTTAAQARDHAVPYSGDSTTTGDSAALLLSDPSKHVLSRTILLIVQLEVSSLVQEVSKK